MVMVMAMAMAMVSTKLETTGAAVTPRLQRVIWLGTVALLCALLMVSSGLNAIVSVTSGLNPELALSIDAGNARARAARADTQLSNSQAQFDAGALWQSVTTALQTQALSAKSLRLAAVAAELRQRGRQAEKLMALSNAVSRQELGTQIWMINKAVADNDVAGALFHYDVALRSSDTVQETLFPTLLGAIEEPAVRVAFGRLIKSDPPWMATFLLQSIATSPNSQVIASAVNSAGQLPTSKDYRTVESSLLNKLVDQRYVVEARQLYLRLAEHDPRLLASTAFGTDSEIRKSGNMGWQLFSGAVAGAEWRADEGGRKFHLQTYAGSGDSGHVARKILYVGPGSYQLVVHYGEVNATQNAALRWDIRCAEDDLKPAIWQVREQMAQSMSTHQYSFVINERCVAYFLNMFAEGGSSQEGMNIEINAVNFVSRP